MFVVLVLFQSSGPPTRMKPQAVRGGESGDTSRFNERGALSLCGLVVERECKGTAFF